MKLPPLLMSLAFLPAAFAGVIGLPAPPMLVGSVVSEIAVTNPQDAIDWLASLPASREGEAIEGNSREWEVRDRRSICGCSFAAQGRMPPTNAGTNGGQMSENNGTQVVGGGTTPNSPGLIPEPSSLLLALSGVALVTLRRRC